jgi:hypothetical protein
VEIEIKIKANIKIKLKPPLNINIIIKSRKYSKLFKIIAKIQRIFELQLNIK